MNHGVPPSSRGPHRPRRERLGRRRRGQPVSPPPRRSTSGSARREGGDVAGRWRRSTTTMPRGKPRAGPHRAGPARARRRVARRTVRPHRGPGARGTRRRGLADRQGAAAQSSMPTRRSSGRPRGGCAPAGNGGRGRCRSVAVPHRTRRAVPGSCSMPWWVFQSVVYYSRVGGDSTFNGLGGDGAWRPRARRGRTRRAPGLAGVAATRVVVTRCRCCCAQPSPWTARRPASVAGAGRTQRSGFGVALTWGPSPPA